jgi:hypothetical protein
LDIFITTKKDLFPQFSGTIVFWNSFADNNNLEVFSIPSELEKNPTYYRSRYLEWVESIAKMQVGKQIFRFHLMKFTKK